MKTSANDSFNVYVDVDDTMVRSVGAKRIPVTAVVKKVKELRELGATLYCWSAGGAEYARSVAQQFGIDDCFVAFLPKPNVLIDDQRPADWPGFLHVHPMDCDGQSLSDYIAGKRAA